jgi:hypothetical protein
MRKLLLSLILALPSTAGVFLTYPATHKHGIGGCSGELQFRDDSIAFISDTHPIVLSKSEIRPDGDGVIDASGNKWHFKIAGENVREILERWFLYSPTVVATTDESAREEPTRVREPEASVIEAPVTQESGGRGAIASNLPKNDEILPQPREQSLWENLWANFWTNLWDPAKRKEVIDGWLTLVGIVAGIVFGLSLLPFLIVIAFVRRFGLLTVGVGALLVREENRIRAARKARRLANRLLTVACFAGVVLILDLIVAHWYDG